MRKLLLFLMAWVLFGITAKAQYYPNNFLNENFKDDAGNSPNKGTVVNLILLSVGFNMPIYVGTGHNKQNNMNNHNTNWND